MRARVWITSALIALTGVAAFAHSGATGIVKERMDGMSAMGKAVKVLTPMMRGQTPYDAAQVRASADVMIAHAGETMTRLFPEGTGAKPSSALPTVWEDWEGFTELAKKLKSYAEGMKLGADNGLAENAVQQGSSMMGGTASVSMGGGMMGAEQTITPEMLASMPVDMAFTAVVQTCSACHQKFRAEEK
ncbi:c-type cytochrome [Litoreibacter halocynthiae]|uniref:Cytochrome c556 n=1 Tax=Litoreibacter ascidiaceicola TaxID=1486859 RepID=A0A1M5DIQ5_9RHOB|nr:MULTISPECIES: cytochrome c [Litoreibacter]SHF66908.1 Cytochrome c556 [Litoreibacter ascidiaceicola]